MRYIDLSKIPTPQLRAIRGVLVDGGLATADSKEVGRLRTENAQFKKLEQRWKLIRERELDAFFKAEDRGYILGFSDSNFEKTLDLLEKHRFEAEKEIALSERTYSIKVPRVVSQRDLNALDTLRAGLSERKNGDGRS